LIQQKFVPPDEPKELIACINSFKTLQIKTLSSYKLHVVQVNALTMAVGKPASTLA